MKPVIVVAALLSMSGSVHAQDPGSELDRIEVTGSRITYRDLLDTPAISIIRSGDYLLQQIELVNDSRDEDLRKDEIHQTIAALLAATGERYELLHGDSYRIKLGRANYKVELENDIKRPDTSSVTLYVRTQLGTDAHKAEQEIRELRAFATSPKRSGRTEIDLEGETALGMNRPERYRYELIEAIATDSQRLLTAMKSDCRVEFEGLNSRLEWERISASQLMLYVPYTMKISDCGATPRS